MIFVKIKSVTQISVTEMFFTNTCIYLHFQIALIYTCARLAINIFQVYIPLYLTESLKLEKVTNLFFK